MLQVDSDFLLVLSAVFSTGWKIFTCFDIPGTNMNVAEFVFACMMVVFAIKVVPSILGFRSPFDPYSTDAPQSISRNGPADDGGRGIGRW